MKGETSDFMGFIKTLIEGHEEKIKLQNKVCDNLIQQINVAIQEISALFQNHQSFVEPSKEFEWHDRNLILIQSISDTNIREVKKAANYKKLLSKKAELQRNASTLKQQIADHNGHVADAKIQSAYALIGNVEGRKLDRQQMTCIVKDIHNHLVIAGAGTGKTTTIVGKIKFLLKSGKCKPEDILVLSFTNASASEMSQRIKQEAGCNIEASTFHKLGLNIITKVEGVVPKITHLNLRKFIREQLQLNMQSDRYLNLLSSYLLYNRVVSRSEFDFETQAGYDEYLKSPFSEKCSYCI